ncbi:UNKNOWN [Stylonychia lemnae]|uniref:Uncharacterized protein n=1 Tax=Stylonychia lemnae TaxID=5949 RepID=A0A078AWL0_STYLE|nr:UNKNOWN [Stylonychia lemnae]|eukprot:CDW86544.1 UNKNOWN [Stylonychia lemnae]
MLWVGLNSTKFVRIAFKKDQYAQTHYKVSSILRRRIQINFSVNATNYYFPQQQQSLRKLQSCKRNYGDSQQTNITPMQISNSTIMT